jgi:hypothetical protein
MNLPYTCHNCKTKFDLVPDEEKEMLETAEQGIPKLIKVRCPGCYKAGFTSIDQMEYVVNTRTGKLRQ